MKTIREKPLGHKSYGSIPHLVGSRRGPRDYGVNPGQQRICCERARDKYDEIIVQEKLDGSNVGIALKNGAILALTRGGTLARESDFAQHVLFADWVQENEARFRAVLREGERLAGEWLALAHGTIYDLPHEPFVAFDLMIGSERATYDEFSRTFERRFCYAAFNPSRRAIVGRKRVGVARTQQPRRAWLLRRRGLARRTVYSQSQKEGRGFSGEIRSPRKSGRFVFAAEIGRDSKTVHLAVASRF